MKPSFIFCLAALGILTLFPPACAQDQERPRQEQIICPDQAAAEQGAAMDEYYLGKAYHEGYCGLPVDKKQAEIWYRKAAEQDDMLADYALGEMYFTGENGEPDYPAAKKWYLRAARQGHGLSELRLGFLYAEAHFKGLTTDYAEAEKWFVKAAEQNAGDAQFRLGNFYDNYKEPRDYAQGFLWLKRAAENGHRIAMFDLGRAYKDGRGVAKDAKQALVWLTRAAEDDVLQAKIALSEMYAEGDDVEKDLMKSLKWTLSIANDPSASIFWLDKAGDIFFDGWETLPKNYPMARRFYERAALKGDPHARAELAVMYRDGLGVDKNPEKAKEYLAAPHE